MRKYLKELPLWVKTGMVAGIVGIIVTLMQGTEPSLTHINLTALTFGVIAYSIL
ncbi:MAG TPA: hypothetical protein VJH55_03575 [Candidatus Paceibacterota bacterium]